MRGRGGGVWGSDREGRKGGRRGHVGSRKGGVRAGGESKGEMEERAKGKRGGHGVEEERQKGE